MNIIDKPLEERWQDYELKRNPFPPAASGVGIGEKLNIPKTWETKITHLLDLLMGSKGPKAFPLIGRYGSGKTYLLRWLEQRFAKKDILPYFFDNPGLQFYDLANTLMKKVGRYEFSKALWELSKKSLYMLQPRLIELNFEEWLGSIASQAERESATRDLMKVYLDLQLTDNEEIAFKLAKIVTGTVKKPYFDYRDFVAGGKESLVAEKAEAPYFRALIRALIKINNVSGVVFLLDEFEEVSSGRRMSKRQGHEYLSTLRRLINLSEAENLWIIMAITEEGAKTTEEIEPGLWERFTEKGQYRFAIEPLNLQEAESLLKWWFDKERLEKAKKGDLFPFPDGTTSLLKKRAVLYPRTLVRFSFFLLSEGISSKEEAPFRTEFVQQVIDKMYPKSGGTSSGIQ